MNTYSIRQEKIPASLIILLTVRALFFSLIVYTANSLVKLGTSPLWISLSGAGGIAAACYLFRLKLKTFGLVVLTAAGALLLNILFFLSYHMIPSVGGSVFYIFSIKQHVFICLGAFIVTLFLTWALWKFRHTVTFEILVVGFLSVYLLSSHRNYHLDSPQIINDLAWTFGVNPQTMFVISSAVLMLSIILYTFYTSHPLASYKKRRTPPDKLDKLNVSSCTAAFALLILIIATAGRLVYLRYDISKGITTNGVGEAASAGDSPLGFHSALGSSNEPAGLIRLEGDYAANPFKPMLYFRESALSEFNGHELVVAGGNYDNDISKTHPKEPFIGVEDKDLSGRVEVVQSIYLLSNQKDAFAIDYPVSIRQLKNPDPSRFRFAYRAYSLAPTYSLDDIRYDEVGDPRWPDSVRLHYLKTHPDPRYETLALQITEDAPSPVEKAFAIVDYLNKTSIYTLAPNHDVDPKDDPVAPFLFGDHRGYCVHFAHATVYMLRALGIPSRIATGYLTDLRQSRDGHILLRMSDRHAWAEVYIKNRGWVPFDTEPQQVESAADTNVDMNLLEELMAALEPGEEILPEDTLKGEKNITPPGDFYIPDLEDLLFAAVLLLAAFLTLKSYLRLGWLLPGSPVLRLRRGYLSVASLLCDLGMRRKKGETLLEFSDRLGKTPNAASLKTAPLVNSAKFGKAKGTSLSPELLDAAIRHDLASLKQTGTLKRAAAFINPSSLLQSFSGRLW